MIRDNIFDETPTAAVKNLTPLNHTFMSLFVYNHPTSLSHETQAQTHRLHLAGDRRAEWELMTMYTEG